MFAKKRVPQRASGILNIVVIFSLLMGAVAFPTRVAATSGFRFVSVIGNDDANDCSNSADPCASITHAIAQAVAGDTIEIASGAYTEAGVTIDQDLTLIGAGADSTIVQAAEAPGTSTDRVFFVEIEVTAAIEGLTIQNGNLTDIVFGAGGGIHNAGTLTLSSSIVRNNYAVRVGGGISNGGTLTINDSAVSDNLAVEFGGGILNSGTLTLNNSTVSGNSVDTADTVVLNTGGGIGNEGTLILNNSTVSGNSADTGGGLTNDYGDFNMITLNNSTVSGNWAQEFGGGFYNSTGTLVLNYSTVANNTSDSDESGTGEGGGIFSSAGTTTLQSSIVAGNRKGTSGIADATADCSGFLGHSLFSIGYNLTGSGTGCELSGTGDRTVDPADVFTDVLGTLADNGGPTQTHAFISVLNNPAPDAIPGGESSCGSAPFDLDQRGQPRPFNFNCDIGAYESQSAGIRYVATFGADASGCSDSDNPCSSITYALTQAVDGDAIRIAAGTYTEAGITIDKDLTLIGAGVDETIVQAAATFDLETDRVFFINNGNTVTIEGLTVQHARLFGTIIDSGAGIFNDGGSLTLNSSSITNNGAVNGAGIFNNGGTLTLNDSTVSDNTVGLGTGLGGGIYTNGGTLTLNNSIVSSNQAAVGGGIYNDGGTLLLNNSTVSGNAAGSHGGGILNVGTLTLNNSTISGNSAGFSGGIYNYDYDGTVTLNNSTVSGNSTDSDGGGITNFGTLTLNYSTVTNNISDSDNNGGNGGGLYNAFGAIVNLQSSILAGNKKGTSGITDTGADCYVLSPITSQGYNLTSSATGCDLNGTGDVTIAPADVFTEVLAPLAENGGTTETHALVVSASNPALKIIPSGTNDCGNAPFNLDQRGQPRLFGMNCDMGAYESQLAIRHVATTGADTSDCSDMLNPCRTITYTINEAAAGDIINIAAGIYTEAGITVDKDLTITGADATSTIIQAAVSYGTATAIVFFIASGVTVNIGDMTIRHGNAVGWSNGGGIYNNGSLTLNHSIVSRNQAYHSFSGSGIYNNGSLTVKHSTVYDNQAWTSNSGSIYNTGSGTVILNSSTVSENAGGIYNAGMMSLNNSTVSDNRAIAAGGGLFNDISASVVLSNSTVSGNMADNGGGIYNGGMVSLNNSTISGNKANINGGGINNIGTLLLDNSTVSGNTADTYGGGIFNNGGTSMLKYSTVTRNTSNRDSIDFGEGGGISNAGGTVTVQSSIVAGNPPSSGTESTADCHGTLTSQGYNLTGSGTGCSLSSTGDLTIAPASVFTHVLAPLANNGGATQTHALVADGTNPGLNAIPSVANSCGTTPFDLDQRGLARPFGTNCDIGAYEAQSVPRAVLTVTATDQSKDYGQSDPVLTFTYSGFVNGDNATDIDTPPTCSVPVMHDNVGSYPIVCSGGVDDAYAFSYIDGVLTVNPLIITRYVATTGTDTSDCSTSLNPCLTITYAIAQAIPGDIISIAAGTYTEAGITVNKDLTLTGAGPGNTIVQAAAAPGMATDRVFLINCGVTATIEGLTIENGLALNGAGLFNCGVLMLNNSTVRGNFSLGDGGGVINYGTVMLNNSTVSSNSSGDYGGGIHNSGTLTLNYSTVANNTSNIDNNTNGSGTGGGLYNFLDATANLKSSLVIGNKKGTSGITDASADCSGTITSQGYNLTGNGTGCSLSGTGDVVVSPFIVFTFVLDILADNGGATQTYALIVSASNPALNAIPNGTNGCGTTPFDLDQRGEARPFNSNCDIGAYEAQSAPPVTVDQTITITTNAPTSALNGVTFTVAATSSSGLPVSYSSSGACTNAGAGFTMTSGTGTCTVMYDQAGDANFNPAPQITENVTAQKAVLTVTADMQSKIHGEPDPVFTFTYSGFVNGDDETDIDTPPTCTVAGPHSDEGTYPIICAGGVDDHYTFTYVDGTLTVIDGTRYVASSGGTDDSNCLDAGSPCSTITHAISQAFAGNAIYIASGTYTEAGITVDKNLALIGAGAGSTIVQAAPSPGMSGGRVFFINDGVTATIEGLTIRNGGRRDISPPAGGGIFNDGILTLRNSVVSDNAAIFRGGGISNSSGGTLTLENSTVKGNSAEDGGGLYNNGGYLELTSSTVSGNSAELGGGIYNRGTLTIAYSTVANNTGDIGGIFNDSGTTTLESSIVMGNKQNEFTDVSVDCSGTIASEGYNLTGAGTGCDLSGTGDRTVAPEDAFTQVLAPLADNGGPSQTHALILSSDNPALNAIPGGINSCGTAPFDLDQRGQARPFNSNCDIGAYEAQSAPAVVLTVTADAQSKVYGESDPVHTFTYSGFVNGDDETDIDMPPTCTVAGPHSDVGTYPILCSGGVDDNYTFTYIDGTLTVDPKVLTITADDKTITYGDPDPAFTFTYTGFVAADTAVDIDTPPTCTVADPHSDVGTYSILCSGGVDDNYIFTYIDGTLTVDLKVLMITADDQTITYGDPDPAFTFNYSGLVIGDTASDIDTPPTCTVAGPHSDVGTYPIVCSGGLDDNYSFNYIAGTLTILGPTTIPDLLTPANAEQLLNNRPTFDWTDVPSALSYTIQISGNINFNGSPITNTVTSSIYTQPTNLPVNVPRYWRVRANTSSGPGPWSVVRSFITANPPSAPGLVSPGNNSLTIDYTPLLDWNDSTVPAGTTFLKYEVLIATNSAFFIPTSFDVSAPVTNSSYTPYLDSNTTYYWRVRAYNTLGQYSVWSAVRSFRTALLPPTLVTPTDGEQALVNRPTFEWDDVPGAVYRIQISNNVGFTSTLTNATVTTSTYTRTTDLPFGVTLYWRVRSDGANGPSAWSEARSLITTNPPSVPTLASPGNNSLTTDYTPLLDWNDSTVPAGTTFLKYELQIATDSGFTSPTSVDVSGLITNSDYTPSTDLDSNTTYYWRVRAYNTLGQYSAWSAVRSFRTALLPPTLVSPIDAEQMRVNRPTFKWDDVAGATSYRIQISNNVAFSGTLTNASVTSSTYTRTSDLPFGATVYWRVRSDGANGPSAWSEVRSLLTTNPPSVPTLSAPGNNAKVSGPSPLFNWNDSTLPAGVLFDHYQIQIALDSGFVAIDHDNNVEGITNSQDIPVAIGSGTTYYWRVRAFNTLGHASAWSTVRSVRIIFAGPTLYFPDPGSIISSLTPTFIWGEVIGAATYRIQISTNSTFSSFVINQSSITTTSFTPSANLLSGTTYYWRVRVDTPTGTYAPGDWSVVFTFTTP